MRLSATAVGASPIIVELHFTGGNGSSAIHADQTFEFPKGS